MNKFYDEVKAGDFLGTYRKQWYYLLSRFIALICGKKISHIIAITSVLRAENKVIIQSAEMVSPKGFVDSFTLTREGFIDHRFKGLNVYWFKNKFTLNETEERNLCIFWKNKILQDYKWSDYAITQNWFVKLFKIKPKLKGGVCSTAARESMVRLNKIKQNEGDPAPDPVEFENQPFIEGILQIQ